MSASRRIDLWQSLEGSPVADLGVSFRPAPASLLHTVDLLSPPSYVSPFETSDGRPVSQVWGRQDSPVLHVALEESGTYTLDFPGRRIWVDDRGCEEGRVVEDLSGPILAWWLRRRGVVCLHASAVLIEGAAVAFLGPQGAGKSTLTGVLALRGAPVVTDDVAALVFAEGGVLVQPGLRAVRMRRGARGLPVALLEAEAAYPASDCVDLWIAPPIIGTQTPVPLRALYWIDSGDPGSAPIEVLSGADALMTLISDTWGTRLLTQAQRVEELDRLAELVRRVPMRRVARRDVDPASLADAIWRDVVDGRSRPGVES